ncbi:MAG TPA: DUF6580 family putative transport protein [Gemmata sp.]|nr:DUF6580 family putative transport protein [Gemmata sp.]
MTGDPIPEPRYKPMTLTLALLVGVIAAIHPLLDERFRPWNFAAFGALGLFVAARVGFIPALLLSLGSKLVFDFLNYQEHGRDAAYLPIVSVYVSFAFYAALGWLCLRRTECPWKIAGITVLAGVPFFLITNYMSWLGKSLPYPDTFAGLLESYWMALPFYRGTFMSDLVFSGALFGAHAILSRVYFRAERVAIVAEDRP